MSVEEIRTSLLNAGVKNLKGYGYPSVNVDNIMTDEIFRAFFKEMLKTNLGVAPSADLAIYELLEGIEELDKKIKTN